ncbi:M23 family metallopeptidase [Bdellovibrionota bacterium FG-1]
MKLVRAHWIRVYLGAIFLMGLVGCSTVQPLHSQRKGFLDRMGAPTRQRALASSSPKNSTAPVRRSAGLARSGPGAVEVSTGIFHWPLKSVQVTSVYGRRGSEFHEGIDLRAPSGTPVYAAQDGTVIYAGSKIRGYGRLVVLRHQQEVSTVYAHNSRLLVKAGQFIHVGQQIAVSGNSGHSSGPHLHFEVRSRLAALDPMRFLAKAAVAKAMTKPRKNHMLASGARR